MLKIEFGNKRENLVLTSIVLDRFGSFILVLYYGTDVEVEYNNNHNNNIKITKQQYNNCKKNKIDFAFNKEKNFFSGF